MSREIKFRGKRKDNGEWVFGYYVNRGGKKHQIVTEENTFPFEVIPESVGQLTGLPDKNGKEIYAGDIFGFPRIHEDHEVLGYAEFDEDAAAFVVVQGNGGWNYLSVFLLKNRTAEIIGNVYETPELLNQ